MDKIYLKRSSMLFSIAAIIISTADMIFGINLLIKEFSMPSGNKTEGIMHAIFFIVQGIIFIIWSSIYLYNRKYYIGLSVNEIELLIPGNKTVEIIPVKNITSLNIRLFDIEVCLPEGKKSIDLNSLNDNDLRKVKDYFEKIRKEIVK